jgi:dienelactone hydrolase
MKIIQSITVLFALSLLSGCGNPELPVNHGKVELRLYMGSGENQPLIVGLGGAEGGNAWDSDRWKETRDRFLDQGYAFLALGYFGAPGTPEQLDRISINGVHDAILEVSRNPKIDPNKIALIGGSKGAELALLLASHYPDLTCVVGIVPSHATFPALTFLASTSSWMQGEKEVPFVPMTWAAAPSAVKQDLRKAFEIMMEDQEAVKKAIIQVEKINGPILLLSATKDEMWPSSEMSDLVMERLKSNNFRHVYEHIKVEGGHREPLDHFDEIFNFLNRHFKNSTDQD